MDQTPRLEMLGEETPVPGMHVEEIDLAVAGRSVAPFKASRWTVAPEASSILDRHSVHECWLVAAGEGDLESDGQRTPIRTGDILYFPPFVTHRVHNRGPQPMLVFSVWWDG